VPGEVSVISYDDWRQDRLSHINLTTVDQDPERMARRAVESVVERLEAELGMPPLTPNSHPGRGTRNRLICRAPATSFVDRHRTQSRRSVRSRSRASVALRDDRWPRPSREIRR
jgi:hypothetical protein